MLSSRRTTLEGGYRKLNADDIYRQNMDATHSRTVPTPGQTYRDHKRIQNIAYGEGKRRAAIIIIQDNTIDALLITQLSDNYAILLEISNEELSFYAASVYFDYNEPIDNIKTVERILKFSKGKNILLAIDSNSRSITWHDAKTNPRGKGLEEFLT